MTKYVKVANVKDIPSNGMKLVKLDDVEILLIQVKNRFYAFDNRCPHLGYPLFYGSLNGKILRCGFHYAEFDVTNGKPINKVTTKPLKKIKVRIVDSEILVKVSDVKKVYDS